MFVFLGVSANIAAAIAGFAGPGFFELMAVALLAGLLATTASVAMGCASAVAAHRLGLDPDTHGVPVVTSSLDLFGAFALILAVVVLGLA